MVDIIQLTKLQEDTLREICSIGAGHAATALSQMLGKQVNMSVPQFKILPIAEIHESFKDNNEPVVGLFSSIYGEVSGSLLLIVSYDNALKLADYCLQMESMEMETPTKMTLTRMQQSVLVEISNIIASSFLTAITSVRHKFMAINVPHLAIDLPTAIIDYVLIELAQVTEQVFFLEVQLYDVQKTLSIKFIIFPNPGLLKTLLDTIGME